MRLSKNFSLKELIRSETATRKGINNNPNEDNIENLQRLCDHVLQPVRDHFGKVVSVSSGFRSPELCVAIGSSVNSQHASGQAADFEIYGLSNKVLADWLHDNLVKLMLMKRWPKYVRLLNRLVFSQMESRT